MYTNQYKLNVNATGFDLNKKSSSNRAKKVIHYVYFFYFFI